MMGETKGTTTSERSRDNYCVHMLALPEASERPPPPPLTQMTRLTTRGTGLAAVSSRMTPVERMGHTIGTIFLS